MTEDEIEQEGVEAYDAEMAKALASLQLAGEVPEVVEKPSVLVDRWVEAKARFENLLLGAADAVAEANLTADKLATQHGIRVNRLSLNPGLPTEYVDTGNTQTGVSISVNQQPVNVDDIRQEAQMTGGSDQSFAQGIAKSLEGAMRNLKF